MKKIREEILGLTPEEANIRSLLGHILILLPTLLTIFVFLFILGNVISNGWSTFSNDFPSFITGNPIFIDNVMFGGVAPMIFGTFALTLGAMIIAVPLGVMSSIYMSEYLVEGKLKSFNNQVVNNLAGVPSIIFGLFGYAYFINYLGMGVSSTIGAKPGPSLAIGWLVLGFMALPIIIKATNNAIDAVPKSFREASQALGANKWETIVTVTVPLATPGISTGVILGIGRIIGETAAILFTAVVGVQTGFYPKTIWDPVMALTYHIYYMGVVAPGTNYNIGVTYATALTLMILVLMLSAVAIYIRYRALKKKRGW
jgi:phosphate transport system permease protein